MIKFGTDGWREIIGRDFTFENVERVAQAYADLMTSPVGVQNFEPLHAIPLGFDRRFLSDEFAKTVACVLAGNELSVLLSQDYCPTPCISWTTKSRKAPGGVVITASHNPFQWNGIKFKESYGGSASPAFTQQIEERIEKNEKREIKKLSFEEGVKQQLIQFFDPTKEYVQQLRSFVDLKQILKANLKIAYDPLYGAGAGYLAKVLEQPLHEIHGEANPGFGGLHPEPIEKNLSALMNLVRQECFDVGLATDGDADRIGAVDEAGNFVTPQQIYVLLLSHLIEKGNRGDIVKTVSTTHMIDRIAAKHGLKVHETPIGFKHICSKFLEIEPLMGGEESGGIGIPSHVYERDGLLAGLLLLEIMALKKKGLKALLQDLTQEFGSFVFKREDVPLTTADSSRLRETMGRLNPSTVGSYRVRQTNRLDGVKLVFDEGWLLFRLSGTEPLIRLYAEAKEPALVNSLLQEAKNLLELS
ncbi:MAG: phosphoglucomutase/phosphomannomutase family protein [Deltaproteobacteria bacterium]|nr:phosphoglucomutase/phosphomannomutase family protein [Deltaproteobacteria bacterium]